VFGAGALSKPPMWSQANKAPTNGREILPASKQSDSATPNGHRGVTQSKQPLSPKRKGCVLCKCEY